MFDEYEGDDLTRDLPRETFNAAVKDFFRWVTRTMTPGLRQLQQELAASASPELYEELTTYYAGDVIIGTTTGARYPCLSATGITGEDPEETAPSANWGNPLTFSMADVLEALASKNLLVNARGSINQRNVSGAVSMGAGLHAGHDMFCGGASGGAYTFATSGGVTTFTVTSGTIGQVVSGDKIRGGVHTLSYQGTAPARIAGGTWGASGVTADLTAGEDIFIEFGVGTFSLPMLTYGAEVGLFDWRDDEEEREKCYRRLFITTANEFCDARGYNFVSTSSLCQLIVRFPAAMEAVPTVSGIAVSYGSHSSEWPGLQQYRLNANASSNSTCYYQPGLTFSCEPALPT